MSPKNCNSKVIQLYSSTKFATPADTQALPSWDVVNDKIKFLIKFVSVYNGDYFKSSVALDVLNVNGVITKKNITVKDICFKHQANVSISSQTQDYQYLYDISCSSADNNTANDDNSCDSSSLSMNSIINKSTEKAIATNVKAFFASNAFVVTRSGSTTSVTLDVSQYTVNSAVVFSSAKASAKYKFASDSSCSGSGSETCSESGSSSCLSDKIVKYIMIAAAICFALMLLMKLMKKHSYGSSYGPVYDNALRLQDQVLSSANNLIQKGKSFFGLEKNTQALPTPIVEIAPVLAPIIEAAPTPTLPVSVPAPLVNVSNGYNGYANF